MTVSTIAWVTLASRLDIQGGHKAAWTGWSRSYGLFFGKDVMAITYGNLLQNGLWSNLFLFVIIFLIIDVYMVHD